MRLFQPKLFSALRQYNKKQFLSDLVAGLVVAIIALPLSVALAIASGVAPEQGLYTAMIAGGVIAFFGGSRVNISGPTAAFATTVAGIVFRHGVGGLAVATVMAGVVLILMGVFRLGSLIRYIPTTITVGFTSGIAVTILVGQLKDFFGLSFPAGTVAIETGEKLHAVFSSLSTFNPLAFLVGVVGLLILIFLPKLFPKIPASLVCVLVGTLAVTFLPFLRNVTTIGDLYAVSSGLPPFSLPPFQFSVMWELLPDALTIALLAGIESLLSCVVSDGMIEDRHDSNTELMAQGIGNIASGFFGGIPATGAIARTAANVKNGGRTPISGIVHALVLFLVLLFLMPLAAYIPMPIIAAVLIMVAYNMSEWRHFLSICRSAPKSDIAVLVTTFVLTVVFDLVVAIAVGLVLASLLLLRRMAHSTRVRMWMPQDVEQGDPRFKKIPEGAFVVEIDGPMFFGSSDVFSSISVPEEARVLILRLHSVPTLDISGGIALLNVAKRCKAQGTVLYFAHLNEQPRAALKKAGLWDILGEGCVFSHVDEALAKASEICENATESAQIEG